MRHIGMGIGHVEGTARRAGQLDSDGSAVTSGDPCDELVHANLPNNETSYQDEPLPFDESKTGEDGESDSEGGDSGNDSPYTTDDDRDDEDELDLRSGDL